jgi:hypothetical protein
LHAQMGKFEDARLALETGETLLRAVSDQLSLGILLCNFAEAEFLAGSLDASKEKLSEAEKITAELAVGAGSELGLALTRVQRLVAEGQPVVARAQTRGGSSA